MFTGYNIIVFDTFDCSMNSKMTLQADNFIGLYIPSCNIIIFMVKAYVVYNDTSPISKAYEIFMDENNLLQTNFKIVSTSSIETKCVNLIGENILLYKIDLEDPIVHAFYTLMMKTKIYSYGSYYVSHEISNTLYKTLMTME